ncbi:MAG: hypothetical protein COS15_03255 [Caldiserica bacterium CG02_land_8_20_14_3_00_36_38]|nr:flippase-like domain-containing protein [Caldisericota bacterium]OIP11828.1 MAG: hypothetical protein AUJ99_06410 [Caldisericum sp. CG2_30_36_11]PIP49697.1 MAG: hypothetical protein COX13_02550 [Caldiserica bacterium CG23_combo_of_CG06-09_8_20_14_all_35_60]PIV55639.1 MAG: hypothetical protein COS15_03255 [Caldiserica bacterium CG02_land_8_20_14_3_00_36_38]PIW10978.1 MAG: hypothetical protein COW37_01080 [Caldiserica bacterium CG17_big_fil_post_rev_8_21_14_2_50_35_7]PIX29717.1 MAG: hypotheti
MDDFNKISKKTIAKETLFALFAGLIGILLISFLTHNWNFISLIKSFQLSLLLISFLMMIANWFLEAYVLEIITSMLNYKISFRQCLSTFLIGGFFSRITPFGGGGGEPVQVYVLSQENNVKAGDSTAIIAIKTFIGTFVRLAVFLLIPFWFALTKPTWTISRPVNILINSGLILTSLLFLFLIIGLLNPHIIEGIAVKIMQIRFFKKIFREDKIKKGVESLKKIVEDFKNAKNKIFQSNSKKIYYAFFWSFISWGLVLFTPVVLMRGLGINSPWPEIVITAVIFYISSAYIPTPGGSGTSEIEILALFARLIPQPLIGVFVITWRLFTHYFLLLSGGLLTLRKFRKGKSKTP